MEQSIAVDRYHADAQLITTIDEPIEKKPVEYVEPKVCDQQNNFRDDEEEINDVLRNSDNNVRDILDNEEQEQEQQAMRDPPAAVSLNHGDSEVRKCPVCDWEFPQQMNIEGKNQHIEGHFQ